MKALKKLLAILLALTMALSMVACDSSEDDRGNRKNKRTSPYGNDYETPLKLEVAQANAKSFDEYEDLEFQKFNGLCQEEMEDFYVLTFELDGMDQADRKDEFERQLEYMEEDYGKNYQFSYTIENEEKISKRELQDYAEEIQEKATTALEYIHNLDADDIGQLAENQGITTAQMKKHLSLAEDIAEEMEGMEITEGYDLEVVIKTISNTMDEPEESEIHYLVYKVNGKWISGTTLYNFQYAYEQFAHSYDSDFT